MKDDEQDPAVWRCAGCNRIWGYFNLDGRPAGSCPKCGSSTSIRELPKPKSS